MMLDEILQGYVELGWFSSGLGTFLLDDFETTLRFLSVDQYLKRGSLALVPEAVAYQ